MKIKIVISTLRWEVIRKKFIRDGLGTIRAKRGSHSTALHSYTSELVYCHGIMYYSIKYHWDIINNFNNEKDKVFNTTRG